MLHRTAGRASTLAFLAICALSACDQSMATDPAFARGGNGKGKGPDQVSTQPPMTITPTQLSLAVGQQQDVTVTYYDARGNAIDGRISYYGCRRVVQTDPDCWSVIGVLPFGSYGGQARITGKAPGTVILWVADGLGNEVTANVTVQ